MKKLSLFLLMLISLAAFSQDKVIKNSGDTLKCKVTEIGADQIKYYYSNNEKLIFGIDKALVKRIEFSTGEVIKIESNSFDNPEYYINQNKNILKFNFLSPINTNLEFIYERSIRPGRSWETSLGIIGLGFDPNDYNPRGAYGKFAYKFIRKPDYYMQRMHYAHLLKGAYIAPEFALRYTSYDSYVYNDNYWQTYDGHEERIDDFAFAVTLKFGKQWVIDDGFIVDLFLGIGYGFTTNSGDNYDVVPYGFIVGSEVPLAFTGGLRIGWAF
jgi:hypothetical protein